MNEIKGIMPIQNPIPVNAPCGECNTDTCEGCPYKEELDNDGYFDEVGGFHEDAIGWNPQGIWCGECTRGSCKDCPNEHETVPAYEKKIEQVFVIECTAWDEPEIHKTYEGAFKGLIENIKNIYSECVDDFGNNPDPSDIIDAARKQYKEGRKTICVQDSVDTYYLYSANLMD